MIPAPRMTPIAIPAFCPLFNPPEEPPPDVESPLLPSWFGSEVGALGGPAEGVGIDGGVWGVGALGGPGEGVGIDGGAWGVGTGVDARVGLGGATGG